MVDGVGGCWGVRVVDGVGGCWRDFTNLLFQPPDDEDVIMVDEEE